MGSLGHRSSGVRSRHILALTFALAIAGCASAPDPAAETAGQVRVLLLYGDGRPDSVLAFPDSAYEALIRFDLAPEQGVPRRLWFRPSSPGTFALSLYESSALDGPGELLERHERVVPAGPDWDARSGRWMVEELTSPQADDKPRTLWVGVKKLAESPGLWCSDRDAGHYYMRSLDPSRHVALVPVRRAPLIQLELAPPG